MIDLTQDFKDALTGPLKYLIQISEDDGVSWATLPSGAEVVSPLGSLTGETEMQPFQFVGSDIEITAFNENGFWTNSAKTGKLDTGLAIKVRIRTAPQSIDDEWVQLIEGYVDLSTVTNYRTGYTVVFTVRGTLNVLDSVLANYVLADRPATYPWKFGGWLQIVSVDGAHPEGLFELKLDAAEGKISWDNGIGKSINTDSDIVLTGQNYNVITVRNLRLSQTATALAQTSGTISQWVAVKSVSNIKGVYQPSVSLPIDRLKALIFDYVDLEYSDVDSFPIKRPDPNIINYVPESLFGSSSFTKLNPVHVVGIDATRWLISFDGDAVTGNYILTIAETPYFKVQSFADANLNYSNSIVVNSYKTATTIYFLCEVATARKHTYLNTITDWGISKHTLAGMGRVGYYGGTGSILYNSFVGNAENSFYAAIITTGDNAKTNNITISGASLAYSVKTATAYDVGISMAPADIVLDQFYVCATGYTDSTENKVKVYLQIYDITNAVNYNPQLTEIESPYDAISYWQMGPVAMARNNIITESGGMYLETFGLYILLSPIAYNSTLQNKLDSDKSELHEVLIDSVSTPLVRITGEVIEETLYHSDPLKLYFYTSFININVVGDTIEWLSGDNDGETKTITTQETIPRIGGRWLTKITMDTAVTNRIDDGDSFRIYKGFTGANARYTYKKSDLDISFLRPGPDIILAGQVTQSSGLLAGTEYVKGFGNDNETLFKNVPLGYPLAGDYNSDGTRILIATQDNIQVVDLNQADGIDSTPEQYPEVALADFEDKTLRDAIEEVAISANCFLMPSEHNKRLSLIYRGKTVTPTFTLLNTEYKEGPRATPYYDYDAATLNDKKAGVFYAGNKQRDLSLTTQATPDAYSQSLANDILEHIGSGDRTHEIIVSGRLELEPGDEGYLELEDGTQVTVRILGIATDPLTLDRSMTVREISDVSI